MNSKKLIQNYQKLPLEAKKKKLIAILDNLKLSDDVFRQVMVRIKVVGADEQLLIDTYRDIVEFGTFVYDYKVEEKFKKTQEKIQKIREEEKKENK